MERGWIAPSPSQATGSQSFPYPFTTLVLVIETQSLEYCFLATNVILHSFILFNASRTGISHLQGNMKLTHKYFTLKINTKQTIQISQEIACFSRAAFQFAEVSPPHHFFPCLLANTTQYFKNPVISGDSHSRKVWAHGFFYAVWSHISIANNFVADSNYTVHYTSEGPHEYWFRLNKISIFTT